MVFNSLSQVNNPKDEYGDSDMTTVFIQAKKRGGYAGRRPIIKTNPNRKKADRAAVLIRINRGDSSSGKIQTNHSVSNDAIGRTFQNVSQVINKVPAVKG